MEPDAVCAVCTDPIDGASCSLPGCGHLFHTACALSWAQYDVRCPVCRAVPTGVTPRRKEDVSWTRVILSMSDEGVLHDVMEEQELRQREWTRYRTRRRRLLNRRPDLLAMFNELHWVRSLRSGALARAHRLYDQRCRQVWREDPGVHAERAASARLRRRELRLERSLTERLHEHLGDEPAV